ncbi:hypothetical protein Cgig2_009975 [Carnegiea gigantea]|uniref:Uncharacterized protein n=1 Tax=Carnegiea gigantea TaxID=171969 RepID=A0A9Q1Q4S0_9CARY|nr:hypothetical protein Cgig2_009975 [Carnegiea gigantea]
MWALQQLYWGPFEFWFENIEYRLRRARALHPVNPPAKLASSSTPVEVSSLGDTPPVSSDEDGDIPEGLAGPQVEGRHPQFLSLPACIDGRAEPKKIPDAVPLFEPGTLSWSNYEYSSTPIVLSPEVEVSYPWEITIADYTTDFQVPRMVKTKSTERIKSPDELLAEGTQVNPCFAPSSSKQGSKVASISTSCTSRDGPGSHVPDPKVVPTLKRMALEKQYLLPAGYTFVILEANATVNEPPAKCIVVYRMALNYGHRFPLQPASEEILNKYELAAV